MGPHWFCNETLLSQAEGRVPLTYKGFAPSLHVLEVRLCGETAVPCFRASSWGSLLLIAPSPQPMGPFPPFFILGEIFVFLPS